MDDLGNDWGVSLISTDKPRRGTGASVACGEYADCSDRLKDEVAATFGDEFRLEKVTPSGSDAQLYALILATGGLFNDCMVACGSYVSGTNGGLQTWSTSDFDVHHGPSLVMHPRNVISSFTRTHTVGLPYHIEGTLTQSDLDEYEHRCLKELHVRVLLEKMHGAEFKTLLMELSLAGCGATLSDHALEMIGMLAEHHGFSITLDEIFTGGRTGTMLLVEQKPERFKRMVKYVTMGKWMQAGLVLVRNEEYIRLRELDDENSLYRFRLLSNRLNCKDILSSWKVVRSNLSNVKARREKVLNMLKLNKPSHQTWGNGLAIYGEFRRKDACRGLKNRLVPKIDDTVLERIPIQKKVPEWNRHTLNNRIIENVNAWVSLRELEGVGGPLSLRQVSRNFIEKIISSDDAGLHPFDVVPKVDIGNLFPGVDTNVCAQRSKVKKVATMCQQNGYLRNKRIGSRRIETYYLQPILFLPSNLVESPANKSEEN